MNEQPPRALLGRVRKLLAKADAGVTVPEAEALTAKAAELMARYGIDRARLAAARPETDQPGSRITETGNPRAQAKAHLVVRVASAMRCQAVLLTGTGPGTRVHIFGYGSDLERARMLSASLLVQMDRALAATPEPPGVRSTRAWRRSWLLGYAESAAGRVRHAEDNAIAAARTEDHDGPGAAAAALLRHRIRRPAWLPHPRHPGPAGGIGRWRGRGHHRGPVLRPEDHHPRGRR